MKRLFLLLLLLPLGCERKQHRLPQTVWTGTYHYVEVVVPIDPTLDTVVYQNEMVWDVSTVQAKTVVTLYNADESKSQKLPYNINGNVVNWTIYANKMIFINVQKICPWATKMKIVFAIEYSYTASVSRGIDRLTTGD